MCHVDGTGVEFGPTVPGEGEQGAFFFKGGPTINLPYCLLPWLSLCLRCAVSSSRLLSHRSQPCLCFLPEETLFFSLGPLNHGSPYLSPVSVSARNAFSWQFSYWKLLNLGV